MYLENYLLNLKNHSDSRLDFNPNINCFVGDNGSGKTNFRCYSLFILYQKLFYKKDRMNVLYDQAFMTIEGVFEKDDKTELVQCAYKTGVKKLLSATKRNTINWLSTSIISSCNGFANR